MEGQSRNQRNIGTAQPLINYQYYGQISISHQIQKKSDMSQPLPETKKEEKKNTDVWKLKQEQKKRLKEAQEKAQTQGGEQIDPKKEGKKEKAVKAKKQTKKQEKELTETKEPTNPELTEAKLPQEVAVVYKSILKIDNKLSPQQRGVSRTYQQQLIFKYLDQYITKNDIILYVGTDKWTPLCQQVYVNNFNNCPNAELVCHYQDVSYFLEGAVTKIFIKADYLFANGSLLAKKGALNIALLGEYYNIPIVACGGSWSYNGWSPLGESALSDKYGPQILQKYDWIDSKYLKATVLQVGGVNPRQVSIYPPLIYKDLALSTTVW